MKLITFTDDDAKALIDRLSLSKYEPRTMFNFTHEELPKEVQQRIIESLHRSFHYEVVRWLQDMGANTR